VERVVYILVREGPEVPTANETAQYSSEIEPHFLLPVTCFWASPQERPHTAKNSGQDAYSRLNFRVRVASLTAVVSK
jgi:hypothetical protein